MSSGTPTTFILGNGAILSCATSSGGTFTPINQLKDIKFTATKSDYTEVTNLSSPAASLGAPVVKEYAPSIITPGNATVTGILAPSGDAGQVAVTAAFGTQTLLYWKLQFAPAPSQTTGALRTFSGYVAEKPSLDASLGEAITFNFSIQVTGLIVDTPGAA